MSRTMPPLRYVAEREQDELQPVRTPTPLPDLLPRTVKDIKRMRNLNKERETGMKFVTARHDLPPPYVNDEECDEFEDKTIDLGVLNLSEEESRLRKSRALGYVLNGPSVKGEPTPVFVNGMLYKIVAPDGSWYYYNDTDKYEMQIKFTFGATSDLDFGESVKTYVMNSEFAVSLTVLPGETLKLLSGKVNGFKCNAKAVPLSDEKRESLYGEVNARIAKEIATLAELIHIPEEQLDEEQVLLYCEKNKHPYVDCSFPPCDYSLYRQDLDTYLPRFIPWHRPAAWIPHDQLKEVRLFRREIRPSHVTQGLIGDTYLVSSIAALAEAGHAVRDLFRHPVSASRGKMERALGAYWVTINFNGWWLPVLLDDYLPATREGPELMRCAVDIRRIWVSLLEKAYAKVHGSYANIASGDQLEPLSEFTGFPISRFEMYWSDAQAGDDMIFREIAKYAEKGHLQVLCTPSGGGDTPGDEVSPTLDHKLEAKYKHIGLRLLHSYFILQVESIEQLGLRLLRLRNPWGTGEEWTGAWGKADARWVRHQDVAEQCYRRGGRPSDPDGTFWMEWTDAVGIFSGGGCCHYRRPWFDYRVRGAFEHGVPSVVLEVCVADPTTAYVILSQEDERSGVSAKYGALLLQVFCLSGRKQKLCAASSPLVEKPDQQLRFNFARDVALYYTFVADRSPYYIVPRVHDTGVSQPYILGFLPDTYIGNGIRVDFKKMDCRCSVFSNLASFNPSNMLEDVATEYQIRNPRQPLECVGVQLKDERLREFGLFEE